MAGRGAMKIVYSMPAFMLCGGVVHHCFVIQRLVERGHQVSIYTPVVQDREFLPPLPAGVEIHQHPRVRSNLYTLPPERHLGKFLQAFRDLTLGLRRIAQDLPPDADVIQATFYPNVYAADWMRRRKRSKSVLFQAIHIDPRLFLPMSYRKRYAWLWAGAPRRADHLLAVCEALARSLRERYGRPVTMVGNGIDEELLSGPPGEPQRAAEFLGTQGRPYVLFVGSITGRKGVDTLIEAFAEVRQGHPDLLLALVGKCHFWPYFDAIAERCGVGEHIRKAAGADRQTLRDLLDGASCFAFPSRAEGFGLPPLEAMARGRPVVCTPCEGVDEYARPGENCLQVSPDHPAELARAIRRLLDDGDLAAKLGQGGRLTAAKFTWDRVAGLTEQAMVAEVQSARD